LKTLGGLGSLAALPRAWGVDSSFADLIVFLPGITGSVLQRNNRDVWAITARSVGNALATLGNNIEGLLLEQDPQDVHPPLIRPII